MDHRHQSAIVVGAGLCGVGGNRSKERDRKSELVLRSTYQIFEWDRNNSDRNNHKYIQISSASLETRQASRGDFKLPCLSKHRSQHNFWYRGALLFTLFGQHIDLISYDVQAIKLELTKLYWEYVNQRYTENTLCTWRILCFSDNCNNYGKLTDLSTEG